jgi:hypothetical protein
MYVPQYNVQWYLVCMFAAQNILDSLVRNMWQGIGRNVVELAPRDSHALEVPLRHSQVMNSGANPTTFELTATTPALYVVG